MLLDKVICPRPGVPKPRGKLPERSWLCSTSSLPLARDMSIRHSLPSNHALSSSHCSVHPLSRARNLRLCGCCVNRPVKRGAWSDSCTLRNSKLASAYPEEHIGKCSHADMLCWTDKVADIRHLLRYMNSSLASQNPRLSTSSDR